MHRQPSCCDFCGAYATLREFPLGDGTTTWYACPECSILVEVEDWNRLIERSFAAYGQIHIIPKTDEPILREQVENLIRTFRAFRMAPA